MASDGWATCENGHAIYALDETCTNRLNEPVLPCLHCRPDACTALTATGRFERQRVLVGIIVVDAWVLVRRD